MSAKNAKKKAMKKKVARARVSTGVAGAGTGDAARRVDGRIAEIGGWRGEVLERVRGIVLGADRGVFEEWKWDVPVWSHAACGIVCTGEVYKSVVKLTFAKGASIADPKRMFNSSLEGKTRRAIDIREGEKIDVAGLKGLVRGAIALGAMKKGE